VQAEGAHANIHLLFAQRSHQFGDMNPGTAVDLWWIFPAQKVNSHG
jgi:hypothetical protein